MKKKAKAPPPARTWRREAWEWFKSLAIAFVLAMFIRHFFFQAFKIPSSSMEPTLQVGDHLIANKLAFRLREPERGEVIIFKFPDPRDRRDFVKRLVGLPGETITIADGRIHIDGQPVDDPRLERHYYNQGELGLVLPGDDRPAVRGITIPDNKYFVLGDNSANSSDSRYWGFLPRGDLLGTAAFIYWPPRRWGAIQ